MSYLRARIFYGMVLISALTLGYNLSSMLIQKQIEDKRVNEYHRITECVSNTYNFRGGNCVRMIA